MNHHLPGAEVHARGLRWEVVFSQQLGAQTLYRLRWLENAVRGREMDLLHPFERIQPVIRDRLRAAEPAWEMAELRAVDLSAGAVVVGPMRNWPTA